MKMPREAGGVAREVTWWIFNNALRQCAEFTRAVSAALVVGAAIGFCLGLIASRWIL